VCLLRARAAAVRARSSKDDAVADTDRRASAAEVENAFNQHFGLVTNPLADDSTDRDSVILFSGKGDADLPPQFDRRSSIEAREAGAETFGGFDESETTVTINRGDGTPAGFVIQDAPTGTDHLAARLTLFVHGQPAAPCFSSRKGVCGCVCVRVRVCFCAQVLLHEGAIVT